MIQAVRTPRSKSVPRQRPYLQIPAPKKSSGRRTAAPTRLCAFSRAYSSGVPYCKVTLSIKVDLSLAAVPVKVMVCAPLVETEKGTLKAAKLVLAGDTGLPTGAPSIVDLDRAARYGDIQQDRCAALNDSV